MISHFEKHLGTALSVLLGRIRAQLMRWRGARLGRRVRFGSGCRLSRPWTVSFGEHSEIEHQVFLKVTTDAAELSFGAGTFVGTGCEFDISSRLEVGERVLFAPGCFVTDHQHRIAPGERIVDQGCEVGNVRIGSDSWIGTRAVILPGVTIGEGAVVGAGAVVTRDVAPGTIVAGVPARVIGIRK
jgi:acetyltransferase-like isoleucine patch superfamily enzyme